MCSLEGPCLTTCKKSHFIKNKNILIGRRGGGEARCTKMKSICAHKWNIVNNFETTGLHKRWQGFLGSGWLEVLGGVGSDVDGDSIVGLHTLHWDGLACTPGRINTPDSHMYNWFTVVFISCIFMKMKIKWLPNNGLSFI